MGVQYSGTRAIPRLDLGAAMMEYMESQNEFIGTRVLPIFKTQVKEAAFSAISREGYLRDADTKRAPRSGYNRDGFEAEDKTFACEEHGLEGPLDDSERNLYASDFAAELVTTKVVARRLLQAQEKRIADLILNTSTFTGASLYSDYSGAPWDAVGSDVIGQISVAREKVRANCGMPPNALLMSRTNLERLVLNTAISTKIQYTSIPTYEQVVRALSGLLNLKYIYVADGVRNSAKEGQAFAGADIWGDDYAMVARLIENSEDLKEPGLGRTFLWVADSPENATVEEYRDETVRSNVYRVRQNVDEMLLDANYGHMLKVDA